MAISVAAAASPPNVVDVPTTSEARMLWAVMNRKICLPSDHLNLGVDPQPIDDNADDETIRDFQGLYEKIYERKKKETEEKEKKARHEEYLRMMEDIRKQFPEISQETHAQTANATSTGAGSSRKRRSSASKDPLAPKPTKTTKTKPWKFGVEMKDRCDLCTKRGSQCHEQDPPQVSCCECRRSKQRCSFKDVKEPDMAQKGVREGLAAEEEEMTESLSARSGRSNNERITCVLEEVGASITKGLEDIAFQLKLMNEKIGHGSG